MNSNHLSNWHESSQEKADFRQPQSVKSDSEWWEIEESQSLQKNSADLQWLQTLYDGLPCICFTLNSAGVILATSQFGASYLGYETLELTQKSIAEIFYWEDRGTCRDKLTGLQQQPTQSSQWEARLVRQNGEIVWVKAIAKRCDDREVERSPTTLLGSLILGTQSNPIITLVCEDISDRKQLEKARQESEARLKL